MNLETALTIVRNPPAEPLPTTDDALEQRAIGELSPVYLKYKEANKNCRVAGANRKTANAEFRAALIKVRDEFRAQGRKEQGFKAVLKEIGLKVSTAYRIMGKKESDLFSPENKFAASSGVVEGIDPVISKNIDLTTEERQRQVNLYIERVADLDAALERVEASDAYVPALNDKERDKVAKYLRDIRCRVTAIEQTMNTQKQIAA